MKPNPQAGMTLVEIMVALTLGLILLGGVMAVFETQTRTNSSTVAQSAIQDEQNAIAALVIPVIRGAGFLGCAGVSLATSDVTATVPPPLGTLKTVRAAVYGYDYAGTAGTGSAYAMGTDNVANDSSTGHWSPALDASFMSPAAVVEPGSDVVVVLGAVRSAYPVTLPASSPFSATVNNLPAIPVSNYPVSPPTQSYAFPAYGALSTCNMAEVFAVDSNPATPTVNSSSADYSSAVQCAAKGNGGCAGIFTTGAAQSAQYVPVGQTAFFVGQGASGESALMQASLLNPSESGKTWTVTPLVPGVEFMQVLYGIGALSPVTGVLTANQYVPAGSVVSWGSVVSIRLGFLLEGEPGSAPVGQGNSWTVLGTTVTVPQDTRLRHVFEMTVNLRNSI